MKFDEVVLAFGFEINNTDECVYHKRVKNKIIILCLYVDNILIFGTDIHIVNEVKQFLHNNFDMKDLGMADLILNTKIIRSTNRIEMSQSHYVDKILNKFNYSNIQPVFTPFDPSIYLKKNLGEPILQSQYAQIIGSLGFLANYTRPDIAYAVNRLSRYTHNHNKDHWIALERVLRYLKGTKSYSLKFSGFSTVLEGYSNANWIGDSSDVKSTTRYVFLLGGAVVS